MSSVIARILNYFLVPLYTRVFNTGEYGIVTELYAYVAILIVILTYGLETGYFRFAREHEDEKRVFSTAFLSLFTSSSVFFLIVVLFRKEIAGLLGPDHQTGFIVMLGCVLVVDTLLAIPYSRLRFQGKSVRFAVFKTINISINIALNLFFLLLVPFLEERFPGNLLSGIFPPEFGIGYIFLSNLIASCFNLLLFLPAIVSNQIQFSLSLFKRMMAYSLPLLIAGLGGIINETIDRVILKYRLAAEFGPLEQLGIYGANIKIAVFMTLFVQMYRYAAEPFFFQQHKEDKEGFLSTYSVVNRYFIYSGLFVFTGIVLFLDVFQYFIGAEFREGLGIVPVILFSNLLLGVFFNLSFWYKFHDKTRSGAYITLTGVVITIAINYFFIPVYGYFASAWAHIVCNFSMVLISFYFSRKFLPADFKIARILLVLILSFFIVFAKSLLSPENIFFDYIIRFGLLTIFVLIVFWLEKVRLKRIIEPMKFTK